MDLEKLKYPIGKFKRPGQISPSDLQEWIETIRLFPDKLNSVLEALPDNLVDTPYRPDGWTVRQLVNHIADSHLNSYIRFKWTMTEDIPLIKTYDQGAWADLADGREADIKYALMIINGVHGRWVYMMDRFLPGDFKRELKHPEFSSNLSLEQMLSLYAWHCDHHLAHILGLMERSK